MIQCRRSASLHLHLPSESPRSPGTSHGALDTYPTGSHPISSNPYFPRPLPLHPSILDNHSSLCRNMSAQRNPSSLQVQARSGNISTSAGRSVTATEDAALLRESQQFRRDMEREVERWMDVLMESPSVDRRFLRRAVCLCNVILEFLLMLLLSFLRRVCIFNRIFTTKYCTSDISP
jgi:hypothetical protein